MKILQKTKIAPINLFENDTLDIDLIDEDGGKTRLAHFTMTKPYANLDTVYVVEDVEGLGLATSLGAVIGREL